MIKHSFYNYLSVIISVLSITVSAAAQKTATTKPAAKPTPSIFGKNLIKNGDAESGNGNGWTTPDDLKTLLYGEFGGGPTPQSPGPRDRGERYFYVRTTTDSPVATFSQKIDVSDLAETIDKGQAIYNFGGWFGVANGSSSAGRLKVSFLDASGKELAAKMTDEITEENRPADEVLTEKDKSGNVPVGTRQVSFVCEFKLFGGHTEIQDNLAFADNISFVLKKMAEKQ